MANELEVRIPDIGEFDDVEIVEVLVSAGDRVEAEDSLVTLESDKATMEIPAPAAGTIVEMKLALGDRVSEGSLVLILSTDGAVEAESAPEAGLDVDTPSTDSAVAAQAPVETRTPAAGERSAHAESGSQDRLQRTPSGPARGAPPAVVESRASGDAAPVPHASPLVRGFARGLGVDLRETSASGPAGRILMDDVRSHVRGALTGSQRGRGGEAGIPPVPAVDFSKFGPVEEVPLAKIRRVSATNLHRSWLNVPHVTQHDEADISELELFRKSRAGDAKQRGLRLSPLLFLLKAVVISLRRFPDFRSSLTPDGQALVRKEYFHVGVAVDTEHGLVVPVVRDVDQKSVYELASEVSALAEKARTRKLGMGDMQGAVFTISSLGGIGGTAFTPIVNAPEVAVLGVSRTATRPVWVEEASEFAPRQMLPLSLSYDHRVIDGASAARFTTDLCRTLSDPVYLLG